MRTTLSIDDDILEAARELADLDRKSMGEVISSLARKGLAPPQDAPRYRNGIRLMPTKGRTGFVTTAMVNRIRDEFE